MTFTVSPRQLTVLSILGDSARRMKARHTLTAAERHNMRASFHRTAIFTASMGGPTYYR
ncbi:MULTISPECIES: hypothetical protein [unclassified Nocardia]|uniref:hypothetical protein n=1 Tax=unclassified Nocardia TaxID=2637762 RepID=UPI002E1362F1|nr:hypothetical protein OG326_30980 [Nocardia sp. NBC_01327]